MNIDHIQFYVNDAQALQAWFVRAMNFQHLGGTTTAQTQIEIVGSGQIALVLASPRSDESPVAAYLQRHPPGVGNVAFQVTSVAACLERATHAGAVIVQPIQHQGALTWAVVQGIGDVHHTLIERKTHSRLGFPGWGEQGLIEAIAPRPVAPSGVFGIDHIVLNVPLGELQSALSWYETVFGFQRQQRFTIQTANSALCSQVLKHPQGNAQLPINEPASPNSQVQEFLNWNGGSGVQHIALQTQDAVAAIAQFRRQGVQFLAVPPTYYDQLRQRPGFALPESLCQAIAREQILVDWHPDNHHALLLQTFTQPIFQEPTFFFEVIERKTYTLNQQSCQAEGFGEGNFRALFEAIEQEQRKRGSLQLS